MRDQNVWNLKVRGNYIYVFCYLQAISFHPTLFWLIFFKGKVLRIDWVFQFYFLQLWFKYDLNKNGFLEKDEIQVQNIVCFFVKLAELFCCEISTFLKRDSFFWNFGPFLILVPKLAHDVRNKPIFYPFDYFITFYDWSRISQCCKITPIRPLIMFHWFGTLTSEDLDIKIANAEIFTVLIR